MEFVTNQQWDSYARRIERANLRARHSSLTASAIARRASAHIVEIQPDHKGMFVRPGWHEAMRGLEAELKRAYRVAARFCRTTDLAGYCLEASISMAEHLRRRGFKVKLIRRELPEEQGGHWTIEVGGTEYDPTCSFWRITDGRPRDAVKGQLYTVTATSPHDHWKRTRVHQKHAYETVGITPRKSG